MGLEIDRLRIVLVRPLEAGNVGACVRACANMGFHDPVVVVSGILVLPALGAGRDWRSVRDAFRTFVLAPAGEVLDVLKGIRGHQLAD